MKHAIAALAAILIAPAAFAQSVDGWDEDGDGMIAAAEFVGGLTRSGSFEQADADASGMLDAAEWAPLEGVMEFGRADLNGDGAIDASEHAGILFARYDADASGALDETEMATLTSEMAAGGPLGG